MHSMTGFGRGAAGTNAWHATVEISAVNRKQAEVVIQAPRELMEIESRIRKTTLEIVSRGRIQVSINLERAGDVHLRQLREQFEHEDESDRTQAGQQADDNRQHNEVVL